MRPSACRRPFSVACTPVSREPNTQWRTVCHGLTFQLESRTRLYKHTFCIGESPACLSSTSICPLQHQTCRRSIIAGIRSPTRVRLRYIPAYPLLQPAAPPQHSTVPDIEACSVILACHPGGPWTRRFRPLLETVNRRTS